MKIVHISSYYTEPLAKGYQVYQLVKEQIESGHEVHIVTCNKEFNLKGYKEQTKKLESGRKKANETNFSELGAKIHRLNVSFSMTGRNWWSGFKETMLHLNPDYILVHNLIEFQSIRILYFAKQLNCPLVFDDHTTINVVRGGFTGGLVYFIFRNLFAAKFYNNAKKIVGISDSCIDVINNIYGIKGEKVNMIPLGADTSLFYPDKSKRQVYRGELNISDEDILITYTGKINTHKKVHLIIDALNEMTFEKEVDIVILIVGVIYDDYQKKILDSIAKSKFRVVLLNHVTHEELGKIYNASDIAVWPAHTTTSTLDASACGCPIICSDYKSERYKNDNGIGIPDGDLESLKAALLKLISDKELRHIMGHKGLELIEKEYTWHAISERFLDV